MYLWRTFSVIFNIRGAQEFSSEKIKNMKKEEEIMFGGRFQKVNFSTDFISIIKLISSLTKHQIISAVQTRNLH